MDNLNRKWKYLSFRVKVLLIAAYALLFFLLLTYMVMMLKNQLPLWPFCVGAVGVAELMRRTYFKIVRPYQRLEQEVRVVMEGYTDFNSFETTTAFLSPAYELMLKRVSSLLNTPELLKLNKRQAQYLALQNQINPHFLYNTLESIRSEALIAGLTNVSDMTEALAQFFRYTISKVENLVSVEEELENCMTYFRIQQYRFGSRLDLNIICDAEEREEIYRFRIPKLTLQPIMENSIIHGTECKIGTGHLTIRLRRTENRLLICISDDGVGMNEETLSKLNERLQKNGYVLEALGTNSEGGIALMNVNNRIQLLFGEEYGMHVFSMEGIGTDVEISFPMITSDRELKHIEA